MTGFQTDKMLGWNSQAIKFVIKTIFNLIFIIKIETNFTKQWKECHTHAST